MIQIILSIIILIAVILLIAQKESFQLNKPSCYKSYIPNGETKDLCILKCKQTPNCNDLICNSMCNNCTSDKCKWTKEYRSKLNSFKSDAPQIKGFIGNGAIHLSWIKPYTEYPIEKYYIILQSGNLLEIFILEEYKDLVDFYIKGLQNGTEYNIFVIAKNKIIISDPSNIVTIVPNENSTLKLDKGNKNNTKTINNENSNNSVNNTNNNTNNYFKNIVYNEVKDILVSKLKINNLDTEYNINIY